MALFAAFDILFGIEVDSDIYSDVWVICLAVLWPWVALYAIPRNFDDPEGNFAPVWLRFIAGILLVPIASIYLVVLYAYGISILVSWDFAARQRREYRMRFRGGRRDHAFDQLSVAG